MFGALHAWLCARPRVNDIAVGIALMLFGIGLAFFLGKPLIGPTAPRLPAFSARLVERRPPRCGRRCRSTRCSWSAWSLTLAVRFVLLRTRWGLVLRTVGESADAARAMGYDVARVRLLATMAGGFLAGVGGSFLSLFYPGSWNEGLSSGQGLMAVALVIFARWDPVRCLAASLLFGGASALGPGAAVGGRDLGLLPVQRRALRADAGDHHRDQLARSGARSDSRPSCGWRSERRRTPDADRDRRR